ncbi:MAG: toprim domain-containing protein [Rickettsiales bacterium]|jgi:hypothetical protein|nr:toprim domain-containing protein [Rickettsiales bacterium]
MDNITKTKKYFEGRNIKIQLLEYSKICPKFSGFSINGYIENIAEQTTSLKEVDGKVVKNGSDKFPAKMIKKGTTFKNNPFYLPKIPEDLREKASKITGFNYDNQLDCLYVCEGLEDALSIRQITGQDVLVTIGIANLIIDFDSDEKLAKLVEGRAVVIVFDKADLMNAQTAAMYMKVIDHYIRWRDEVYYIYPTGEYKDINEALCGTDDVTELSLLMDTKGYIADFAKKHMSPQYVKAHELEKNKTMKALYVFGYNATDTIDKTKYPITDRGIVKNYEWKMTKNKDSLAFVEKYRLNKYIKMTTDNIFIEGVTILASRTDCMEYLKYYDPFVENDKSQFSEDNGRYDWFPLVNQYGEGYLYKSCCSKVRKIGNREEVYYPCIEIWLNKLRTESIKHEFKLIWFFEEGGAIKNATDALEDLFDKRTGSLMRDFTRPSGLYTINHKTFYNVSEKFELEKEYEYLDNKFEPDFEDNLNLYMKWVREVVCGGSKEDEYWIHNWIACAVQDPLQNEWHNKTSLYFISDENSTGKSLFAVNIIGALLSGSWEGKQPKYTCIMTNRDWDEKFSTIKMVNKTLCVCDEMGAGNNRYEMLKNIISSDTISVENKFETPYSTTNACRFVFTTNKNKIPLTSEDVRLAIFKFRVHPAWIDPTTGDRKPPFDKIVELFDSKKPNLYFLKYLYNFYKNLTTNPKLLLKAPNNEAKKEEQELNKTPLDAFGDAVRCGELNMDVAFERIVSKEGSYEVNLKYYIKEIDGLSYIRSVDLLRYFKKVFNTEKRIAQNLTVHYLSRLLISKNIDYKECRGYKFFKVRDYYE